MAGLGKRNSSKAYIQQERDSVMLWPQELGLDSNCIGRLVATCNAIEIKCKLCNEEHKRALVYHFSYLRRTV